LGKKKEEILRKSPRRGKKKHERRKEETAAILGAPAKRRNFQSREEGYRLTTDEIWRKREQKGKRKVEKGGGKDVARSGKKLCAARRKDANPIFSEQGKTKGENPNWCARKERKKETIVPTTHRSKIRVGKRKILSWWDFLHTLKKNVQPLLIAGKGCKKERGG